MYALICIILFIISISSLIYVIKYFLKFMKYANDGYSFTDWLIEVPREGIPLSIYCTMFLMSIFILISI